MDRAKLMASLAGAAYCPTMGLQTWDCGPKCSPKVEGPVEICLGMKMKAIVATADGAAVVAFEGLHGPQLLFQDLRSNAVAAPWDVCDGCAVHTAYVAEWEKMRPCIVGSVKVSEEARGGVAGGGVRLAGHSFGGAVAALAAVALASEGISIGLLYTFGAPRAGNDVFVARLSELLKDARVLRISNRKDPMPNVPPKELGFEHFGPGVLLDGSGDDVALRLCESPEDQKCAPQPHDSEDSFLHGYNSEYLGISTSGFDCMWPAPGGPEIMSRVAAQDRANSRRWRHGRHEGPVFA